MTGLHVVFGAGQVGSALAAALATRGDDVRVVHRGRSGGTLPAGVQVRKGDAGDPEFARAAAADATVVYGTLHAPYDAWDTTFPRLQRSLVGAAGAAGARLVVLENLYMYGEGAPQPLTEDTPMRATGRKGRARAAMTRDLFDAHARGAVRAVSARAAALIGPGLAYGPLVGVLEAVLRGTEVQFPGRLDAAHSLTYLPDLVRAMIALGGAEGVEGRAWHVPTLAPITFGEVLTLLFRAAGHPPRMASIPEDVLAAAAERDPLLREYAETAYMLDRPFVVDSGAFTTRFGDRSTAWEEAARTTVEWFRGRPTAA